MTERSNRVWMLGAALLVLLATIGASVASEQAGAEICTKNCPVLEEAPEEGPAPDPTPTPISGKRSILLVNVGWGDGSSDYDAPLVPGDLDRYFTYLDEQVNEWFAQVGSSGAFPDFSVRGGGSYRIHQPTLPSDPSECSGDQKDSFITSLTHFTTEALAQHGIDPDDPDLLVIAYNRDELKSLCGFAGYHRPGVLPGSNTILLTRPEHAFHELGHYLNLDHANVLRCKKGEEPVPLSSNCEELDAEDRFDAMGKLGPLSYNAIHSKQLGWLNGQFIDLKAPATGIFVISPFTAMPHGTRAIRLQDGATRLWVEYRRPVGVDGPGFGADWVYPTTAGGVVIHREVVRDGGLFGDDEVVSQLLDMTPGPPGPNEFKDPFLPVGKTWANPLGETTITVALAGPSSAIVKIGDQRTNKVPNIVGFTPARAEETLKQAGLVSGGWEGKPDLSCASLGLVMGQFPLAGEMVRPGTPVKFTVGEEDTQHGCL
jgi:PASTA domain